MKTLTLELMKWKETWTEELSLNVWLLTLVLTSWSGVWWAHCSGCTWPTLSSGPSASSTASSVSLSLTQKLCSKAQEATTSTEKQGAHTEPWKILIANMSAECPTRFHLQNRPLHIAYWTSLHLHFSLAPCKVWWVCLVLKYCGFLSSPRL